MDALTELGKRIGRKADADSLVRWRERLAAVLAEIVAAGGDAQVHPIPVAQDGVQAEAAVSRLPFARVLVVADPRNQLPGIAAVLALEERGRLHAAPEIALVVAGFERPDVGERAPVVLWKGRGRFRLVERLSQIGRAQDFHSEEGVAAGPVHARFAARIGQRGVDRHARSEGPAQRELAAGLRRLGNEKSLLRSNGEKHALRHGQPPETAARIVTTSRGASAVSSPSRSRT